MSKALPEADENARETLFNFFVSFVKDRVDKFKTVPELELCAAATMLKVAEIQLLPP